jgi:RNA polymerase sigma-70 factor (ECF subfamily)
MILSTHAISIPLSDVTPRMKEFAPSTLEDAQARHLAAALARGDESAFNQLYDRYHRRLFRLALAMAHGDETLAYDAAEAALLTAAAKLKAVAGEEHLWNWLARVARQNLSKQRRIQQSQPEALSLEDFDGPIKELAAEIVLENGIDRALLALAPEDRQVVEWFYFDGLSHQEIATRLEATVKAVSRRLQRARAKLRTLLERSREN